MGAVARNKRATHKEQDNRETKKGRKHLWRTEKGSNQMTCPVCRAASGVFILSHNITPFPVCICYLRILNCFICATPQLLCMWRYRERDICAFIWSLCIWTRVSVTGRVCESASVTQAHRAFTWRAAFLTLTALISPLFTLPLTWMANDWANR